MKYSGQIFPHVEINLGDSGAGTVTIDWAKGNHQKIRQTGNCNYAAPQTLKAGATYFLRITNDGTGNYTPTFNGVFIFPGGLVPSLGGPDVVNLLAFDCDGTNLYCAAMWTIISNIYFSATDKILGRSTAGAGPGELITCTAAGRALLDDAAASNQRTTLGLGVIAERTSIATADLDNDGVTYSKIQNVSATDKVLGRLTAGAGDVEEITCTAAGRALLDDADAAAQRATMAAAESVINSSYRTILDCSGSHIAGRTAAKYGMGQGDPLAIDGTGTLYPLNTIYIAAADFPTVNGLAPKLRIRAQLNVNNVAPTGNFTFGLYPITRPASSGGTGVLIYTIGTVISGSDGATFTAPAADAMLSAVGADFAVPTDGHYILGVVTTATVAATSHLHMSAQLQLRNA